MSLRRSAGSCSRRSQLHIKRIGADVMAISLSGNPGGGVSVLKRPKATQTKLPAGSSPVPANEPDQVSPGRNKRGTGGANELAISGGVVRPEAWSRAACSSRTVAAAKRPNFVPSGTCGLPIVQMVAVEFVTLASTRQPWLVITRRRISSRNPIPLSPSSSVVPTRTTWGRATAARSLPPPHAAASNTIAASAQVLPVNSVH